MTTRVKIELLDGNHEVIVVVNSGHGHDDKVISLTPPGGAVVEYIHSGQTLDVREGKAIT